MSESQNPPPPRRNPWPRRLLIGVLALLAMLMAAAALIDSSIGHRFIADRIAALRPHNGLRYSVGRIGGSVFSKATLIDFRIRDREGLVFAAPRAELDWAPFAWLANRLEIRRLTVPVATFAKLPALIRSGRKQPILPDFDIRVGELRIERLIVAARVTGKARDGRVTGRADIRNGRAMVDLRAIVAGSDRLALKLDAEPDRDRFDLDVRANGAAGGVLAQLTGLRKVVALTIDGRGTWRTWRGRALATASSNRILALTLANDAGAYRLNGAATLATVSAGKLQRLAAPQIAIDANGTLVDRLLAGKVALQSAALSLETDGSVDLATNMLGNVRIRARLLQPAALFPNMSGRNIELRAILDGPLETAAFDYRLTADRLAFDQTGFENARASGRWRLSRSPVIVPIAISAARVTGVGDVAGGILRNLAVNGKLRVTPQLLTGDDLKFASDKLKGSFNLILDLKTGRYEIGLNGALGRYLIPGLGIVDVTSKLQVVPGPGGRGTRVVGTGTAQMVRLDNSFFATLAGGLPRIQTALERAPDGTLYFRNLVLTAPAIRITGNGLRRRDGTFHFEGTGTQRSYGPLVLKLDGRIERPTIDLRFARPNESMGLSDVQVHLDPNAQGFAFTAVGGSLLGDFRGNGQIAITPGVPTRIAIAALDVGGIKGKGVVTAVTGGLDGSIDLAGGGITGVVLLAPQGEHQRVEAHLKAENATLLGDATLRRGQLDLIAVLDPAGTSIEASARGAGLRQNGFGLARFTATASLRGGTGKIEAAIAGSRGRAFDIRAIADVKPDRYSISGQGTVDRRPIKLDTPAILTASGNGWQLAPARISFAGGNAEIGGRFSSASTAFDATVDRIPLSILDIGYPGLGLAGSASGKLSFAQADGAAPTGAADLTVRGLSRAGLVLTSRPIDLGVSAVLRPDRAGIRAVMASGGTTIGRAQARLAPLGNGSLTARLANAALFAQLRYDGPADTLWRLTGIELFDLSGPVAIGADMTGKVNDPRIKGLLRAKGARIESATTGTVLTNVQAAGAFSGSRLQIGSFTADAGKGGTVTGSGDFDFAAVNGFGIDLNLQAQNAVMINRDDIGATVTGPIAIKSDGSGGTISGDLKLERSRYRLGQAAATQAVPKLNIREINLPGEAELEESPLAPWKLDIKARAPGALLVSGLGLTSEWAADLQIGGAPDNPRILGRADLLRGNYEFSGREFELERGVIRFQGEVPANPALDIAANADATGLSASIRVTGEAIKPLISFTSTPALPQDELLSRLLFGTSITNLSAPEALQLAAAVASLNSGGKGLNPINALRKVAGLDRLRILPADVTVGRTTSVAAGKYITRRLYAEIITDGQGYSATQVEYRVTRWLSILSTISTLGRQSVNVRVSKDY